MLKNHFGFSLMEILIAGGMLGFLALGSMAVMRMGVQGQKSVSALDESRAITGEISGLMNSSAACTQTFKDQNPATGFTLTEIKDSSGTVRYSVGSIYGNKTVKLVGISVGGSGADIKTQLSRYSAITATSGLALVRLEWARVGEQLGPANIQRFFFVMVSLNAGGRIESCAAAGTGNAETIWERNATNSSKIYYADGQVGIGVENPTAALDVEGSFELGGAATIGGGISSGGNVNAAGRVIAESSVQMGNDSAVCNAERAGAIRWTGSAFEGCDGSSWQPLGGGGGKACALPWGGSLASGSTVTAYQQPSVPAGATCSSETRACSNGVLGGTYSYASCAPQAAPPAGPCPLPWGGTLAIGGSVTAYQVPQHTTACTSHVRQCLSNGALTGSFQYNSCKVVPAGSMTVICMQVKATGSTNPSNNKLWVTQKRTGQKTCQYADGSGDATLQWGGWYTENSGACPKASFSAGQLCSSSCPPCSTYKK